MRLTRTRYAGVLLGIGLGAFFEGILLHPIAGPFYLAAWLMSVGGILLLWSAVRGPGPLPPGRNLVAYALVGWGGFLMVEAVARHDLTADWLIAGSGLGLALLGAVLAGMPAQAVIERRSGYDRRSGSPLR